MVKVFISHNVLLGLDESCRLRLGLLILLLFLVINSFYIMMCIYAFLAIIEIGFVFRLERKGNLNVSS